MSQITTHVLDTSQGKPAAAVKLVLSCQVRGNHSGGEWIELGAGATDDDGRVSDLLDPGVILPAGKYKLVFDTGGYYAATNTPCFYPLVEITFSILGDGRHYHVPLLLNPFGYSTYRGS